MNNKHDIIKDEFYCTQCNKIYKTYKTLWEHNKKFHSNSVHNKGKLFVYNVFII